MAQGDRSVTNLRTLDLNLLLVFDTVYVERNITRAAAKLNLSQPAVSNALTRLRERLDDPLFERSPEGMRPTARARAMAEPVRQALDLLERGVRPTDVFDFARSERRFVFAVEDYGETVVLPRFVDWLAQTAPGIRIQIRPEHGGALAEAMSEGRVDLGLDYFVQAGSGFRNECVLTDGLLALARPDHPQLGERLTLETYLSLRHVVLTPRTTSLPMIDLTLAKRGLRRQVVVEVPHFLSMPAIVQMTQMVCTLPGRMARLYAEHFRLRMHEVPLRMPTFPVYLTWHQRADEDPAHRWLREQLIDFCRRL